jgi:glycerophosphoryl diester phosphodiesterase
METKASRIRLLAMVSLGALCLSFWGGVALAQVQPDNQGSTTEDFLRLGVRPIAIGHHGVGPNSGANPNPALPIENTVDSVRQAYTLGARVVEVDVQLTQDGKLAVFHDDFLSDFTCIHALTLDQLQQRLPYVPELRQVINVALEFNSRAGDDLDGILIVELKAFSPHCDPSDVLEQAVVSAAVSEVRQARMSGRVIFDSFSPALLLLAAQTGPEIPREPGSRRTAIAESGADSSHNRIAGDHYQQEKFAGAHLGRDWTGVPFAGLCFGAAVSGDGDGHERSRCWRRDGLLRAGGTTAAW